MEMRKVYYGLILIGVVVVGSAFASSYHIAIQPINNTTTAQTSSGNSCDDIFNLYTHGKARATGQSPSGIFVSNKNEFTSMLNDMPIFWDAKSFHNLYYGTFDVYGNGSALGYYGPALWFSDWGIPVIYQCP